MERNYNEKRLANAILKQRFILIGITDKLNTLMRIINYDIDHKEYPDIDIATYTEPLESIIELLLESERDIGFEKKMFEEEKQANTNKKTGE